MIFITITKNLKLYIYTIRMYVAGEEDEEEEEEDLEESSI